MEQKRLNFVIANDSSLDFDLIEEAWIGEQEVADVRRVNNKWQITFFPEGKFCELSWQDFTEIYQQFSRFVTEQTPANH